MLAAYPAHRTPLAPRRSRAPLRIYAPPGAVLPAGCVPPAEPRRVEPSPRRGELRAIGELLPQVLARYLAPAEEN